jgi:hypothetical protein
LECAPNSLPVICDLDALVVNHARSQLGTVAELDANALDLT